MSVTRALLVIVLVAMACPAYGSNSTNVSDTSPFDDVRRARKLVQEYDRTYVGLFRLCGDLVKCVYEDVLKLSMSCLEILLLAKNVLATDLEYTVALFKSACERSTASEPYHQYTWYERWWNSAANYWFGHATCKKIYHFCSIFHLTGRESWGQVVDAIVEFIPDLWCIFGPAYALYGIICACRRKLRWPSDRSMMNHAFFIFVVSSNLLGRRLKVFAAIANISNRTTQPLSYHDFALMNISTNRTCTELFFGTLMYWLLYPLFPAWYA